LREKFNSVTEISKNPCIVEAEMEFILEFIPGRLLAFLIAVGIIFNAVKEGDDIKISFHPDNPEYVVTPMKTRPSVIWHHLGSGVLIGLGVIFILMILISFAGD